MMNRWMNRLPAPVAIFLPRLLPNRQTPLLCSLKKHTSPEASRTARQDAGRLRAVRRRIKGRI